MNAFNRFVDFVTEPKHLLIMLVFISMKTCYSAQEAHIHTHEAINACSAEPVFDELGRRL